MENTNPQISGNVNAQSIENAAPQATLQVVETNANGVFATSNSFAHAQRVAMMLATSPFVPDAYRNNVANIMIALEVANRMNASPLMVMQNLYIIHGRPSWSSTFMIAALNSSKKFSPLRFDVSGEGDMLGCTAWAVELATGERLEGTRVTISMAKKEGWYGKTGSKWQSMPDQMLRYRSAAFFCRLYAPDVLMGMTTMDEAIDVTHAAPIASASDRQTIVEDLKNIYTDGE